MNNALHHCFLWIFLAAWVAPAQAQVELVFAYQNIDNAPFQIGHGHDVPSSNRGIAVDQILAIENVLDVKVVLKRYPWKRALMLLKNGKVDGVFNASYKKEREAFGRYPTTQEQDLDRDRRSYTNSYSFFVHGSNVPVWRDYQVKQISQAVHVPLGFSIGDDLRKQGVDIIEVSDVPRYAKLLNQKRIDALALLTPSGLAMFGEKGKFENIKLVKPAISEKDYFLMLSHQFVEGSPELAEKVWDAVANYRQSKAFVKGFSKYSKLP